MKTVCLTPTGDRPKMLDMARKWFERATKPHQVDWLVVDDGIDAYDPGGCNYVRRTPDGTNSLGRQLLFGLPLCEKYDNVLIFEDDDWYGEKYIEIQLEALKRTALHGWGKSRYYHLGVNGYLDFDNRLHSSLFETAFRKEFIPKAIECVTLNGLDPYYDLKIWRKYGHEGVVSLGKHHALGIKGGPGRGGYCPGHNPKLVHYSAMPLNKFIGDQDAAAYQEFIK